MKRSLVMLVAILCNLTILFAQTNVEQISIFPIISDADISEEVAKNVTNKLSRMISSFGYGSLGGVERFVLVANMDVTRNDVVPSNPPRVSKSIDMTLMIGDVVENMVFSSCCVTLAGVGVNDTKAYISALSRLSPSNILISQMFDEAQQEIVKMYSNSTFFLTKARSYSQQGEYERAIAYLMTVPAIDKTTTELCQREIEDTYRHKIDKEGLVLYNRACAVWRSTRDIHGAKQVAEILSGIDPYASVMSEVDVLWKDIESRLRANELAELEAEKRAYEERMKEAEMTSEGMKQLIGAAKAVGIAFGVFQPRMLVTNIIRGWF